MRRKLYHILNVGTMRRPRSIRFFCNDLPKPVLKLSDKIKPLPDELPSAAKIVILRHCFKLKTVNENWYTFQKYVDFKQHDTPLSPVGVDQAQVLCKLMYDQEFDRIISSPYRRCVESLLPLVDETGVKICIEPAFRETTKSDGHVNGYEDLRKLIEYYGPKYIDTSYNAIRNYGDLNRIETKVEASERVGDAFAQLRTLYGNERLLICTHSTPCGAIMQKLCGKRVYFRFGTAAFVYKTENGNHGYRIFNTLED